MTIKCDECGKYFRPGERPDGLPAGLGFVQKDGSIYNVCADCIIKIGEEAEKNDRRGNG